MSIKRHGLSIGIERSGSDFFLSLKAIGKLTHEDYETITPMIDSALNAVKEPQVKALIDITELEGWELRAAWDDSWGLGFGIQQEGNGDALWQWGDYGIFQNFVIC